MKLVKTATKDTLQERSKLLRQLRDFFYARNVVEIEAPILSPYATSDAYIDSLKTAVSLSGLLKPQVSYLHSSPEYSLKRLLSDGSGDIFYLGKVFRQGEQSPKHQPEFTMLEWYRLGFSLQDLIDETVKLLQEFIQPKPKLLLKVVQITYQQAFFDYAGVNNIHTADARICQKVLCEHNVDVVGVDNNKILCEQLILTEIIEPKLGFDDEGNRQITCITEFPANLSALAKLHPDKPWVSLRFEIYVASIELANGYNELQNASEYLNVFNNSNKIRKQNSNEEILFDASLIADLEKHALPFCSGVSVGVDRLFMLRHNLCNINEGMCFTLVE